jgi:2-isopropylmalate synthase
MPHPNGHDMADSRTVTIFDTTLRDGEQAPGNAMTARQKVDMALRLEALGVDVIEVGFPASSATDLEAARLASQALSSATMASFARCKESDILAAAEAAGTTRHQIQLLVASSDLHLTYKRGISRADALRELVSAVGFAASLGFTDISVGLEDASRAAPDLLRALMESGVGAGATSTVVADTSGCMLPSEFGDLVASARTWIPGHVTLAAHCHNDMGLALANALAAVRAGADQVQTTLAGVGERAGNTALEELAAVLKYKGGRLGATTRIDTRGLYQAYLALKASMRLENVRTKPIVGDNAFATSAGIHQDGILQKPETYEYLDPDQFGRNREILVGRHSGRAIIRSLLDRHRVQATDKIVGDLYEQLIASRTGGDTETLEAFSMRIFETMPQLAGDA